MSFTAAWLTLREPADHAARDPALLDAFRARITPATRILDIGCGTGSTLRAVNRPARWTLADRDPALLTEAAQNHPQAETLRIDLADLSTLPTADLVTASALFDLCSPAFITDFVAHLGRRTGLYAALNYDGMMEWSDPHPQDGAVVAAFNRHQRRDKGFGPAAGPEAAQILAARCEGMGLRATLAPSPWLLQPGPLHTAFVTGVAEAAAATGIDTQDWLAARLASRGSCRVGHLDLLALPDG
ncbi:class I SAM-dependent methyltransferase [Falsirhodobacter xinxiangensis]|uniref:class I SAM-dependent methyltransferase n=1 Tax=Falsirhodobacter xinxiangensis TaxID=2530049 RepID=UPI0010AAB064|nr:class I SAM-dependent methyltransferase [Rhodobacter xinxiangensis]